jgi:putative MATE family efflux protein
VETTDPSAPAAGDLTPAVASTSVSGAIVRLSWPVMIERLSISVLSAVDAALVGHYVGADGLAAVGLGGLLFWLPLAGALAIDVGATAIVARDVGAGDRSRVQAGLHMAVLAALAWGTLCALFIIATAPVLMRLLGADDDVAPLGAEFIRAAAVGLPMLTVLYAISGALRGMGNAWIAMVILIIVNLVNAGLTLVLINGWVAELGVLASGIGYGVGGVAGGVLALGVAASGLAPVRLDLRGLLRWHGAAMRRLLNIGLPVGLEEAQFMLAFLIYTSIIARLGTDQLAAHSLAMRSLEIAILPAFALATAATALTGRFLGAGKPDDAEQVARTVRNYAVGVLCVMGAVQFALAPYIVQLFVDDDEVARLGAQCLRVFAFALPGMALNSSLSGVLRGAGDVRYVLASFTLTAWGVRVPLAGFIAIGLGASVPFVWLAPVAEHWARAALIIARYRGMKWKSMKV